LVALAAGQAHAGSAQSLSPSSIRLAACSGSSSQPTGKSTVVVLDAGRIDGASEFGIFWRIVIPLSTPGLAVLGIYTFMEQWREFLWPLIVITADELKTLPVGLSIFHTEFRTDYGVQMAGVLLSVLPFMVVFLLFQRLFIKGLTAGALKG